MMGWVTCFVPRVSNPGRESQLNVCSRMTRSSSAASWLRSRHAPIRKGEEKAMRPHKREGREEGRNVDVSLANLVASQG